MNQWRERNSRHWRSKALKRFYGITIEQYEEMHQRQRGLCAVCHQPERAIDKRSGKPFALAVDHCHDTGVVRGLLCNNCNQAIGHAGDDPTILRNAAHYLGQMRRISFCRLIGRVSVLAPTIIGRRPDA